MRFFLTTILLLPQYILTAQDTHYWTQQFGTRSSLMGGAVIGSVRDNSSVLYNPACLAFIDTSSVSVNANVYQAEKTRIENAMGRQKDFTNNNFKTLPLLFSGLIPSGNPDIKIGYSFASSVDYAFKAVVRVDDRYPIVDDAESPGSESFISQASLNSRITETAFGSGIAKKLNDHWSIGATLLFYWRYHGYERQLLTRMFLNATGNPLVSSTHTENFTYTNLRTQLKLGIQHRGRLFDFGLVINTPTAKLFGTGTVAADITANNILFKGQRTDVLANDRQDKLPSVYKTPWSVAGGINFNGGRTRIGLAAGFFFKQGIYDVLHARPASFVRPPDVYPEIGSDDFLRVKAGNLSVLNWALGYEYVVNDRFTFVASLRTDKSYFNKDINKVIGIKPDISSWDIYHIVVGGNITGRRLSLSAGILIGFAGSKKYEQRNSIQQPSEKNLLLGNTIITNASYNSFGILIGFTIDFNK